ncbi:MAG: RNA methyltransferase [Actinomycetota bacterium]|nr:RNA methyltransferase [Actinomycetota bacterium]
MGPVLPIRDSDDQRVDDYRNLTDAELRQREEPAAGLFMVEGPAVIRQLLRSQYPVRSMLLTENRLEELRPDLPSEAGWPIYLAANDVMRAITGFHFHRGALAAAGRRSPADWRAVVRNQSLIAVAEDVSDHENMGALFRNAAAFGVGAILLTPASVDPLYRRAVRVSMGQVLHVPWARVEPWPEVLGDLKSAGFRVLALTPDPAAPELRATSQATAILVGAEGPGLTERARSQADELARIRMQPGLDSLNVATAAAIAFYEFAQKATNPAGR